MKILFAASESAPFVKVGGLGDVVCGLSAELAKNENDTKIDVRVVVPFYSIIGKNLRKKMKHISDICAEGQNIGVYSSENDGVLYYFLKNKYFDRKSVYGMGNDGEVFSFFSRAVLYLLGEIEFFPDVINANDWHTALIPLYLKSICQKDARYKDIKTVLLIHNLEFQGKFDADSLLDSLHLDICQKPVLMYNGKINMLKAGILSADAVCTVSDTYSREILTREGSFGLYSILISNRGKIRGIKNGIDRLCFNPKTDRLIAKNYTSDTLFDKKKNRDELCRILKLDNKSDVPVIGMVSRLTSQKGIDLIMNIKEEFEKLDMRLVILGTGEEKYEFFVRDWERRCPEKIRGVLRFSEEMASKIYAGCDIFLMPSKAEPCGISQMIAMSYGTVPVVRHVGGLKDTVNYYDSGKKTGCGIVFCGYNSFDMYCAVKLAIDLYKDRENWDIVRKNAMLCDFGWKEPAKEYIKMYKELTDKDMSV